MVRTAVVFIHGQGQQRPMDSVRDLVTSAWSSDEDFGAAKRGDGEFRYWSIPDDQSDTYEMHRLATETDHSGRRFDFYEYYWAHLMSDTTFSHVWSWFQRLVSRDPREVPNPLLRVRQMMLRALEMAIAFAVTGIALSVHFLEPYAKPLNEEGAGEFSFTKLLSSPAFIFDILASNALILGLFTAPLLGAIAIAGDWARTSSAGERTQPFNPTAAQRLVVLAVAGFFIPLLGLNMSLGTDLILWLQYSLCVVAIISVALWIVRYLVSGVIVGALGLFMAIGALLSVDLSSEIREIPHPRELDWVVLTAPLVVAVLTATAFKLVSLWKGYFASVVAAFLTWLLVVGVYRSFADLVVEETTEPIFAALAAAWAISQVVLLPEAARFNRGGLKPHAFKWRRGHWTQVLIWLFVVSAPLLLLITNSTFRQSGTFLSSFGDVVWIALVPIIYLSWSGVQRRKLGNQTISAVDDLRVKAPINYTLLHVVLWLMWCVYFNTALEREGVWSAYWMFTSALLAVPGIIAVGIAANRAFLIPVMGDSARYLSPTPENILARQKIRETGVELFETLHKDKTYDRIIVVAHSLGSVVAYDILSQLWARRVDELHKPETAEKLGDVQEAAHALQVSSALSEQELANRRKEFRAKQREYASALKNLELNDDSPAWRITDFVTLGSPLTYAATLLADDDEEFRHRRAKLEVAACPPDKELVHDENPFGPEEGVFAYLKANKSYLGPKHSAVFAAVRWTNLYFVTPGLVTGDLIGGAVAPHFGQGVEDCAIFTRPEGVSFAHNEYWKWYPSAERRKMSGMVTRSELVGKQRPEHVIALREALNLADL